MREQIGIQYPGEAEPKIIHPNHYKTLGITREVKIEDVQTGDVIEFKSYVLQVSSATKDGNWIRLQGRKSVEGCPVVKKAFLIGTTVEIRN